MSILTPLQTNLFVELLNNRGLSINPSVNRLLGAATGLTDYIPGELVNKTILKTHLTNCNLAYNKFVAESLSVTNYTNLCKLGFGIIPALGNTYTASFNPSDSSNVLRFGFMRHAILQAYDEYNYGNSFRKLVQSYNKASAVIEQKNKIISSLVNSIDFMTGVYAGMNDLITSDVTAVNRSPFLFGRDLVATGRAIDLRYISEFGKPSRLIQTMHKYNAISQPLALCLMVNGITPAMIDNIIADQIQSIDVERSIYISLSMITTDDEINQSLLPLNCQVKLNSLADLLDIRMMFPESHKTMVFPDYDTAPANGRVRRSVNVFTGTVVNQAIKQKPIANYLTGIISNIDIMLSCGAFAYAMQQIKKIESVNIEQFAQVVQNLETLENVPLIDNNTGNKPLNNPAIQTTLQQYALGSGKNGLYRTCDFFGSMSGVGYKWQELLDAIKLSTSPKLISIYNQITAVLNGPGASEIGQPILTYNAAIASLVIQANQEIQYILNTSIHAKNLNILWEQACYQLFIEKRTRAAHLDNPDDLDGSDQSVIAFVENSTKFARDVTDGGASAVLDSVADKTNIGGQALFSTLREIRNIDRIQLYGGEVDSSIPDTIEAPQFVLPFTPSTVIVNDQTYVKLTGDPTVDNASTLRSNPVNFSGSTGGSQFTQLVPANLDVYQISKNIQVDILDANQALYEVERCCCD